MGTGAGAAGGTIETLALVDYRSQTTHICWLEVWPCIVSPSTLCQPCVELCNTSAEEDASGLYAKQFHSC